MGGPRAATPGRKKCLVSNTNGVKCQQEIEDGRRRTRDEGRRTRGGRSNNGNDDESLSVCVCADPFGFGQHSKKFRFAVETPHVS